MVACLRVCRDGCGITFTASSPASFPSSLPIVPLFSRTLRFWETHGE